MNGMVLDDFFDMLKQEHIYEDLIVRLAYKYSHEKKYTISNEILTFEWPYNVFMWEHDWDEGQQDVYVLGYVKVENVEVPNFDFNEFKLSNKSIDPCTFEGGIMDGRYE